MQKEADDSQQRERVARISARVAELTEDAEQLQIQLQLLHLPLGLMVLRILLITFLLLDHLCCLQHLDL